MKTDSVEVKDSSINRKGVFASKNFKKNEVVLEWDKATVVSKDVFDMLKDIEKEYVNEVDGKFIIMKEPEKFVNHSCEPNTNVVGSFDIAIRDVLKGEEITTDYSTNFPEGMSLKCNCASRNCRKEIKNRKKN